MRSLNEYRRPLYRQWPVSVVVVVDEGADAVVVVVDVVVVDVEADFGGDSLVGFSNF